MIFGGSASASWWAHLHRGGLVCVVVDASPDVDPCSRMHLLVGSLCIGRFGFGEFASFSFASGSVTFSILVGLPSSQVCSVGSDTPVPTQTWTPLN